MYYYHQFQRTRWNTNKRTNGMGFDRGRMVITTANKNLELTANGY
ncbi:MAG: hypothetical protein U0Z74_01795 [Romboutsia timonensis]